MEYGGESNAKKIARSKFWNHVWFFRWKEGENKDDRILVLCGPEAADVRCLRSVGIDTSQITAIDLNPKYIEASREIVPEANYVVGDVFEYLRKEGKGKFDVMFFDFCNTVSNNRTDKVVNCVHRGLRKKDGVVGVGTTYGRETGSSLSEVNHHRKRITRHQKTNKDRFESPGMTAAGVSRFAFYYKALDRRFCGGRYLSSMIAAITYHSQRSDSGGVPMIYAMWSVRRKVGRLQGRLAWDDANVEYRRSLGCNILVDHVGSDPEGDLLRKEALYWAEDHPSSRVADFLNLKRQQVAAWKAWKTMRAKEAS